MAKKAPGKTSKDSKSTKKGTSSFKWRIPGLKYGIGSLFLSIFVIGIWFLTLNPIQQVEFKRSLSACLNKEMRVDASDVIYDVWSFYFNKRAIPCGYFEPPLSMVFAGLPKNEHLKQPIRVLPNQGYTTGYCEFYGNPGWVAYKIQDVIHPHPVNARPSEFETDPRTVQRISSDLYSNSGFDRGHMAPNFAIARCYGKEAQQETFLMSNITPQQQGLNRGPWRELEMQEVLRYSARFDQVWILCGPIYQQQVPRRLQKKVAIPDAFFKIIIVQNHQGLIPYAFIFPQNASSTSLESYLTSIDEIEKRTGFDFFTQLDPKIEIPFESKIQSAL